MAHEITIRTDGSFEMAYAEGTETPWHKGGQIWLPTDTHDERIEKAGMGWKIQRSKVRYFADREGATQLEMPEQNVLFRSDTKAPLSVVSAKYKAVQPRQVYEFFEDLIAGNGFTLDTAGTLFGGRKFWCLASIGETASILSNDKLRGYLLLMTSCDGSSATIGKFVATRVVCNNTLSVAMGEHGKAVKASHRSTFDPSAMKNKLSIARDGFGRMADNMQALTHVKFGDREAETFVRNLLRPEEALSRTEAQAAIDRAQAGVSFAELMARPAKLADVDAETKRAPRGEADILRLFRGGAIGSDIPGVRGTAYAMLNAVTEYVDHHVTAKTDSHRMSSAWLNGGDDLKTTAFEQLLAKT